MLFEVIKKKFDPSNRLESIKNENILSVRFINEKKNDLNKYLKTKIIAIEILHIMIILTIKIFRIKFPYVCAHICCYVMPRLKESVMLSLYNVFLLLQFYE